MLMGHPFMTSTRREDTVQKKDSMLRKAVDVSRWDNGLWDVTRIFS